MPGRILFLDDEPPLVDLVGRLLERLRYQVSGFTDPEAALDAIRATPSAFDWVVTDMNMPGRSGLDVAREVAANYPDIAVVLCSGDVSDELRKAARSAGVREVFVKPTSVAALCEGLHQLMRG